MSNVPTAEDVEQLVKSISEGFFEFIDSSILPMEERYRDVLSEERKLFREDGRLIDEIVDARRNVRRMSAEAGYYNMLVSKDLGGSGLPTQATGLIMEGMFRKYGPGRLLIGWSNGFLSVPVIATFVDGPSSMFLNATGEIRDKIVPELLSGESTVCFGLTEPDAGSDVWGIKTKARKDGDDWVISGSKQWITNAPYADYAAVFAITDEELVSKHKGGITCFLIDVASPGFSVDNVLPIMGHVASDCGTISLDDVRVSSDRIMGELHQGFRVGMLGISEGRLSIASGCVGLSEWALDRCLEYVKERKTFGVPLAEHQAIQFMLAESAIDIFTAKQTAIRTTQLIDELPVTGRLPIKEISIAKAYSVEATQRVYDRAIQIHGAMGLSNELRFNEGFRIARTLRIPDGTSEIQRRTIAHQLLRGDVVF
ncbi:MAG: acyl-CoA dehydrogenase family protein [Planctomycetes bacterium]|nr:acyl-CoA dehydrogenase family protein [Planctomycetota bacterium]